MARGQFHVRIRDADGRPPPYSQFMSELEEIRWRAVQERDRTKDGVFVYAVRSTGVYCRPGCGARRPLRRNVEFYPTAADAAAAGYRPCRRCHPEQPPEADPGVAAVMALCARLQTADDGQSAAMLAGGLGWSERHLRRIFAAVTGVSIGRFRRAARAERAKAALRAGRRVTEAVYDAGYGSAQAFYDQGAPRVGMPPERYRAGAAGEVVAYTSFPTPIGTVVAAATARGVAAVRVGREAAPLIEEIRREFPLATLRRDDDAMAEIADVIAGATRGAADASMLSIDVAGTAFQARVWDALRQIPRGQTRSYGEIAAVLGMPRAARAVAAACAANPAALVVPCHRVVRGDGTPGGYRWGSATKAALLATESATFPATAERGDL